ncbi:Demethylsterigmatocystin 6-O-methyltransferase-like protein [Emericellopsis cladophorae]|uniref:Demethylsterigmatocystin 6-O-methyltransferase-like protein n=1 Tax=Emericellopsis cladophorae TaxID=2686198 RepID=A0A9P9XVT6_9HYPO|nr:Demethylsterigmatocystin 6-O-methyltransferase-like protein [Emericellopsis cladophorae]KAI6778591.1 Demethylsterigmatocystin 6-O-methyltransferase-like protein [Emericellopsis cladophorae]
MTVSNGDAKPAEVSVTSITGATAVPSLIKQISALGDNFDENTSDETRLSLCLKARALWKALEAPPAEVVKAKDIAPSILCRLMKHLAVMGYLKELGPDTYERTNNFAEAMAVPIIGDDYPTISGGCDAALEQFSK